MDVGAKKQMVSKNDKKLSIRRQCELIGLNRSSYYFKEKPITREDLEILRRMDEIFTEHPYYGARRMAFVLNGEGYEIGRKKVRRYYQLLGIEAIYPKMNLSKRNLDHKVYPYLLKDVPIIAPNQVWSADITYIRLKEGFVYLVAIIDWYSRKVLSWRVSNTLESSFCVEALEEALSLYKKPVIFNTDQGVQFTSHKFTELLKTHKIKISMDSKGRALDNVFIERFWRSLKQEKIYRLDLRTVQEAKQAIESYMVFYNTQRPHQSLDYKTPQEVFEYSPAQIACWNVSKEEEKKNQKKKKKKEKKKENKKTLFYWYKSFLNNQKDAYKLTNEFYL